MYTDRFESTRNREWLKRVWDTHRHWQICTWSYENECQSQGRKFKQYLAGNVVTRGTGKIVISPGISHVNFALWDLAIINTVISTGLRISHVKFAWWNLVVINTVISTGLGISQVNIARWDLAIINTVISTGIRMRHKYLCMVRSCHHKTCA